MPIHFDSMLPALRSNSTHERRGARCRFAIADSLAALPAWHAVEQIQIVVGSIADRDPLTSLTILPGPDGSRQEVSVRDRPSCELRGYPPAEGRLPMLRQQFVDPRRGVSINSHEHVL